jgi:hypothetical protein
MPDRIADIADHLRGHLQLRRPALLVSLQESFPGLTAGELKAAVDMLRPDPGPMPDPADQPGHGSTL